ncbi:hypothetical protein [Specibacter cremeus]|uniref:hypothetical protein n=1 Tax=Specibacter cremeus TaxID=1629051 RepID=UPI000F794FB1|nr:hypothetical protein [Specibacter cremeus]
MRWGRISTEEWLTAAAAGLWSAAFLAPISPVLALLASGWAGATLVARRFPLVAAAAAGATFAGGVWLGLPLENPAPMAASVIAAYSCGRFIRHAAGLLALPVLPAAAVLPGTDVRPGDLVVATVLYGTAYAFGRLVRRRFAASERAAMAAARLAAKDPVTLACRQADADRARMAEDALAIIGTLIRAMRSAAQQAGITLEEADINRLTGAGADAVARLERLHISLLAAPAPAAAAEDARRTGRRRSFPALSFPALIAALAVCAGLAAVLLAVPAFRDPFIMTVTVGILALTAFAAHAWRAHGRAEQVPLTEAETRQLRFTADLDAALTSERLAVARTAHELAGHAVGAMVVQANAASALRERDPAAARRALGLVAVIGAEADENMASLAADSCGGPAEAPSLQSVIDQVGAAGLSVRLDHGDQVDPRQAPLVHRIVRETLFDAARHAPGSAVQLAVHSPAGGCTVTVTVTVTNETSTVGTSGARPGAGLQDLHALLGEHGGTLKAGALRAGYRVSAVLPAVAAPVGEES